MVPLFAPELAYARAGTGSQVAVTSQNTAGGTITGYFVVLFSSTGTVLSTGFTPVSFSTVAGAVYSIQADSYASCVFSKWSDGITSNPRALTASTGTLAFTAVYNCGATAPAPPTGLMAMAVSSTQINLSWTSPSNDGGSSVTGYMINRSSNGGSTWTTVVANTGTTATSYSDTGLVASTTYEYQVSAINSIGNSAPSNTASATTSASSGTSLLTVKTQLSGGGATSGFFTVLYQSGNVAATGFTPAQFTLNNGHPYIVEVQGYGSYYFQYWLDTGSVTPDRTVSISASLSLTAVLCNGPPGTCPDPTPVNGITVYAHRIPATYWVPCFALACSAGSGPGATMFFVLENSAGTLIQTGFANEAGFTFTGLTPGVTYYVYPADCDLCHGSTHDVVFQYWTGGITTRPLAVTVGASLDAWYSCTNNCA